MRVDSCAAFTPAHESQLSMNVRQLDLQTWANVFANSVIAAQHDDVALLVTRGRHPDLGAIVGVQAIDGMTLISEHPITNNTSGV